MNHLLKAIPGLLLLSVTACTDPTAIGTEIQPKGDKPGVAFTDTSAIIAFTVAEKPLVSSAGSLFLAGSYTDPIFGEVVAGFNTQFTLSTNNVVLGTSPAYDSITISLAYNGAYGDTAAMQTFTVNELAEAMSKDSSYRSDRKLNLAGSIGSVSFTPRIKDSVVVAGKKRAPQLRFRLSDTFGNKLFNAFASGAITSSSSFSTFFKGVFVEPSVVNGNGSVLYFNPASDQTKITLYYRNSAGPASLDIFAGSSAARFNYFRHGDYSMTPVKLSTATPAKSDSVVYVQALSGVKGKILMPHLGNFNSSRIAVNQAELILPVGSDGTTAKYGYPQQLYLFRADSAGEPVFLPDQFAGTAYFGGSYNSVKKTYTFNISRYVQDVLKNPSGDYGLYLVVAGAAISADRVVLRGGDKTTSPRMRLRLTYTKLN